MDRLTRPPEVHFSLLQYMTEAFGDIPFLGDIIEAITGLEDGDLNDLGTFFHNFTSIFDIGNVFNLPDIDILGWATDFISGILNPTGQLASAENVNDALEQSELANSTSAAAAALAASNEQALLAQSEAIAQVGLVLPTKADLKAIPTDVPIWVSLDPLEDVSFPRVLIDQDQLTAIGGVAGEGAVSVVTAPSHPSSGNDPGRTISFLFSGSSVTLASSTIVLAYVNSTRDRIYNTVGFVTAVGVAGTPAPFYVAIFKMDKDSAGVKNGNLTLVYLSGDISASLTNAVADVRVTLPTDLVASKGDYYAVGLIQFAASGKVLRSITARTPKSLAALPGRNPSKPVHTLAVSGSFPVTIAAGSLDATSNSIPWVCMGQLSGISKAVYDDLYERPNSASIGPNWATFGAIGQGVRSGKAYAVNSTWVDSFQTGIFTAAAIWGAPLTSDSVGVRAKFARYTIVGSPSFPIRSAIAMRVNNNFTSGVAAGVYQQAGKITLENFNSPTSGPSSKVERGVYVYTYVDGDEVDGHGVYDAVNDWVIYTVYLNGTPIITWTDSTHVVPLGVTNRFAGTIMDGVSYNPSFFGALSFTQSPEITEWHAKDL